MGIEVAIKETDFRYREWVCRAGNQDCTCWNADMVEEIAAYLSWVTKWNPQEVLFYAMDWWLWYYSPGKSGVETAAAMDGSVSSHGCLVQRGIRCGI